MVPGMEQALVKLSKPLALQVTRELSSPGTKAVGKFLNLPALFLSLRKMQHISLGVMSLLHGGGADDCQIEYNQTVVTREAGVGRPLDAGCDAHRGICGPQTRDPWTFQV